MMAAQLIAPFDAGPPVRWLAGAVDARNRSQRRDSAPCGCGWQEAPAVEVWARPASIRIGVIAMATYVIMDVEVTDPATYRSLLERAAAAVVARGGKYLVRAGVMEVVQGDWKPHRLVVVEFDSAEQAEWRNSQDAIEVREMLNKSSNANILIAEGE